MSAEAEQGQTGRGDPEQEQRGCRARLARFATPGGGVRGLFAFCDGARGDMQPVG
jgi:hypothetical protein